MATALSLTAGQLVSFKLNTNLLTDEYYRVKVEGQVNYDMAKLVDDVDAIHENIYATLPPDTPNSASDYNYLVVRTPSGQRKVVGIPWIMEPVVVENTLDFRVTFTNRSINDIETVRRALHAYGLTGFNIETL